MAGKKYNEEKQKEVTNNGVEPVEPVSQNEEQRVTQEYDMLDSRLDEISTALDFLEQKNNYILEQLMELLKSNIEIREEIQKENANSPHNKN